jgi:hypothetical protein
MATLLYRACCAARILGLLPTAFRPRKDSSECSGYRIVKSCTSCYSVDARMRIRRSTFCARSGDICRSGWDLASHQSNGCNLSVCSDCHVDQADGGFRDPSYDVPAQTTDPGVPRCDLPIINIAARFSWRGAVEESVMRTESKDAVVGKQSTASSINWFSDRVRLDRRATTSFMISVTSAS